MNTHEVIKNQLFNINKHFFTKEVDVIFEASFSIVAVV